MGKINNKPFISTLQCEVAIMKHFGIRANLIVPNVSWEIYSLPFRTLHECDILILSNSGYATEVEIKISKADLLKDREKNIITYTP